ncbi:acyltransferase family protein [Paenibacillus sp. HJL G12]|uniref:Acyltransferase family protein n=1 Tax=Paenibacillus dendrobii TaxID=2691084 RepID=A0A7X3IH26_9BACL|nr:acyltransferase [Paenibacillus dendrobii]MWV43408.1 acyltransferase family protein [Paenibacillus dendrobii]
MPKKARIHEIELLRGLAFLAVALQHAIAHYSIVDGVKMEDSVMMTLLLTASKFAVPMFIFITGLVLFYNYDGPIRYGTFMRKRFVDVLLPYILWSAFYFYMNPAWSLSDLGQWAIMLVTGKNSYHLWYIVMIFQFYLLFPLFRYVMRIGAAKIPFRWRAWALSGAGAVCLLLLYELFRIGDGMTTADIPFLTPFFTKYADRNFLYFLVYFLLGAAAGMYRERWYVWLQKGRKVYWTVFILLFGYYTYSTVRSFGVPPEFHITFNQLNLLRPLITLFLVSSVFVFYAWSKKRTEASGPAGLKLMNLLGRYSYGAYLAHAFMLKMSYKVDARLFVGWNITLRMLMSFLICIVLSYAVTIALSYLPFGKWTVGVSSRVKRRRPVAVQGKTTVHSVD